MYTSQVTSHGTSALCRFSASQGIGVGTGLGLDLDLDLDLVLELDNQGRVEWSGEWMIRNQ